VDKAAHSISIAEARGKHLRLHPAQVADKRVREATFDSASGTFTIPPRTAVVFIE
jgi:pullulanase